MGAVGNWYVDNRTNMNTNIDLPKKKKKLCCNSDITIREFGEWKYEVELRSHVP